MSLTDRYVHAVTRELPQDSRDEVGRELRATVADMVEARADLDPTQAEREALVELGDPVRLAGSYRGRPRQLIGPELYPRWREVLLQLLAIVPLIAAMVAVTVELASGEPDNIVGGAISAAFVAAVQVAFWTTLGFAIAEHHEARDPYGPWTPERLPEEESTSESRFEAAFELVIYMSAILLAFVDRPAFPIGGELTPVVTEQAWAWRWLVVAPLAGFAVFTVLKLAVRRWTLAMAHAQAVLELALVIGLAALFLGIGVWTDAAESVLWDGTPIAIVVIVGALGAWETAQGYRRVQRQRP